MMKRATTLFLILLCSAIQVANGQFWNQQTYGDSFFSNSLLIRDSQIKEVIVKYSYRGETSKLYQASFNSQGEIISENYPYDDSTSIQYTYSKSGVIEKVVNTSYKLHIDNSIRDSTVEITEYCQGKKFKQITYHPGGSKSYCSFHYPGLSCDLSNSPEGVQFYFNNKNQIDSSKGIDYSTRKYSYDAKGTLISLKTFFNYPVNYTGFKCEYYRGDCEGVNCLNQNQEIRTERYRDSVIQYDVNMKGVVYFSKNGLPKSIKLFCLTKSDFGDCDPAFVALYTFVYSNH